MVKIFNRAARFIVMTLLRSGEKFKAQPSRKDVFKTMSKFYAVVFMVFGLIYLLLVSQGNREQPPYHVPLRADAATSSTNEPWTFGRYYQYEEDVPIYVDSVRPIGNSYNHELSFQKVDYYDPLLGFSSLFESGNAELLFSGFSRLESGFSLAKNGLWSRFQKRFGSLYMPPYRIQMNSQQQLWKLGEIVYTPEDALKINTLVRKGYGYQFYIDDLPVTYTHSQMDVLNNNDTYLSPRGIPLGYVDQYNRVVFNNYLSFIINYTKIPDEDKLYEKLVELSQKLSNTVGAEDEKPKEHNEPLMTEDPTLYNYKINAASAVAFSSEYSTRHGKYRASLFPPTYLSETDNTTVSFYYTVQFSERESYSRESGLERVYDHFNKRFPTIATQTSNFVMYTVVLWVTIAILTFPSNIANSINAKLTAINDKTVTDYHPVSSFLHSNVTVVGASIVLGLSAYVTSTLVLSSIFCFIFTGQPFFAFVASLALLSPVLGLATNVVYNLLVDFEASTSTSSMDEKEAESEPYEQLFTRFPEPSSVVLGASGVVFLFFFLAFLFFEALTNAFHVFRTMFVLLLFTIAVLIPGSLVGFWMFPFKRTTSTDLLSANAANNRNLPCSTYTKFVKLPMIELSSQVVSFIPSAIPLFKLYTIVAYGKSYPVRELAGTFLLCLTESVLLSASIATYKSSLIKYYFSDQLSKFYFIATPFISVPIVSIVYWSIVSRGFKVFNTTGGNFTDNLERNSFINHAFDNYNLIWFILFIGSVCVVQVFLQVLIGYTVLHFYERSYKSRSTIY